jgi:hypothetical protein
MPTPTYTPLATVTLGTAVSSVTFSSIPATYRDLILILSTKLVSSAGTIRIRLNGDSGTNYSDAVMNGNGSTTASNSRTGQTGAFAGSVGTSDTNTVIQLMDYSATDKHKTLLTRENEPANLVAARAARYASNTAVTSVLVGNDAGVNFAIGCTFNLYGVIA